MWLIHKIAMMRNKRFSKDFRKFGKNTWIDKNYKYLDKTSICLESNVHILSGARIQNVSDNPQCTITIGENTGIQYNFTVLASGDVTIGSNVAIASDVSILAGNHGMDVETGISYGVQKMRGGGIEICDGCWIGEKVCIMDGVTIGKKSIVGAGSVVTKNIPEYCIAAGNPARIIKKYNFDTSKWEAVNEDVI